MGGQMMLDKKADFMFFVIERFSVARDGSTRVALGRARDLPRTVTQKAAQRSHCVKIK